MAERELRTRIKLGAECSAACLRATAGDLAESREYGEKARKRFGNGRSCGGAIRDSLIKLNPRKMMGNPVMFVVEVGSVITTMLLFRGGTAFGFNLQITLWLWFTVLFANFAEAMAEGRGKAQADTLRKARAETIANRSSSGGKVEQVPSSKLRAGDLVVVSAGDFIPSRRRNH